MSKLRLAIVRQKYRPDGGAERFISRALEALGSEQLDLNIITRSWQGTPNPDWHLHICNPAKLGRVSVSAVLPLQHAPAGSAKSSILCKATSASRAVIFFARVMVFIASGWNSAPASSHRGND